MQAVRSTGAHVAGRDRQILHPRTQFYLFSSPTGPRLDQANAFTTANTMLASIHSPTKADTIVAKIRIRTRAFELVQQQPKRRGLSLGFQRVRPVLLDAAVGVYLGDTVTGGVQRGKKLVDAATPIGVLS